MPDVPAAADGGARDAPADAAQVPRCADGVPIATTVVGLAADVQLGVGPAWVVRRGQGVVALDDPPSGTAGLVVDMPLASAGLDATAQAIAQTVSTAVGGATLAPGPMLAVQGWPAERFTVTLAAGARPDALRDGLAQALGVMPPGAAPGGYADETPVTVALTVVARAGVSRAAALIAVGTDANSDRVVELSSAAGLAPVTEVPRGVCADGVPTLAGAPVDVLWFVDTTYYFLADEDTVGEAAEQSFDALVGAGGDVRAGAFVAVSSPADLDLDNPGYAWISGNDPQGGLHLAYASTPTAFHGDGADTLLPYPGYGDFEQPVAAGVIVTGAMAMEAPDPTYARAFRPDAVRVAGFATDAPGDGDDYYYFAMDPYRWGGTWQDRVANVTQWYATQGFVPFGLSDTFLNGVCPTRENWVLCLTGTDGGAWLRLSTASSTDIQNASVQLVTDVTHAAGRFRLPSEAIPSTLRVQVNGRTLAESPTDGWSYEPTTSVVMLHGSARSSPMGVSLGASYYAWGS